MKSQTPGYLIVPPPSFSKTGEFRVVGPGPRFVCRTSSREAAEIIAALDHLLTQGSEGAEA